MAQLPIRTEKPTAAKIGAAKAIGEGSAIALSSLRRTRASMSSITAAVITICPIGELRSLQLLRTVRATPMEVGEKQAPMAKAVFKLHPNAIAIEKAISNGTLVPINPIRNPLAPICFIIARSTSRPASITSSIRLQ
jgi:hypothetical protein